MGWLGPTYTGVVGTNFLFCSDPYKCPKKSKNLIKITGTTGGTKPKIDQLCF